MNAEQTKVQAQINAKCPPPPTRQKTDWSIGKFLCNIARREKSNTITPGDANKMRFDFYKAHAVKGVDGWEAYYHAHIQHGEDPRRVEVALKFALSYPVELAAEFLTYWPGTHRKITPDHQRLILACLLMGCNRPAFIFTEDAVQAAWRKLTGTELHGMTYERAFTGAWKKNHKRGFIVPEWCAGYAERHGLLSVRRFKATGRYTRPNQMSLLGDWRAALMNLPDAGRFIPPEWDEINQR